MLSKTVVWLLMHGNYKQLFRFQVMWKGKSALTCSTVYPQEEIRLDL
jgi:hypothetical protein